VNTIIYYNVLQGTCCVVLLWVAHAVLVRFEVVRFFLTRD
jgi:hypothetical protein